MYRFLPIMLAGLLSASVGGKLSPTGKEIDADLPDSQQLANVGGSDGAGLCVFTSVTHAARFQHVKALEDFQAWMRKYPGGGWPDKLAQKIKQISAEKGLPEPKFVQAEGSEAELLPLIEAILKSNRMACITYSYSPSGRYGGRKIAHMVNCIYLDKNHACVLDNNYPGTAKLEWITRAELGKTLTGGRSGWVFALLDPGPPPLVWNTGGAK